MTAPYPASEPPYYAAIFSSTRTENLKGYDEMDKTLSKMANEQPGFLGLESMQQEERSITISYWESLDAIKNWKNNPLHQQAQQAGKQTWYQHYSIQICKVEKAYDFNR